MSINVLKIIANAMKVLGLEYAFGVYEGNEHGDVVYPYTVGEYQETEPLSESGLQEGTFMLNMFHRGTWLELEEAKAKIESYFNKVSGKIVMVEDGSAVAFASSSSNHVPRWNMFSMNVPS